MKSDDFVDPKYVCGVWVENGLYWTESWGIGYEKNLHYWHCG